MPNGFVANLSSRKRNKKGSLQSIAAATTTNKQTKQKQTKNKKTKSIFYREKDNVT